MTNKEIYEKCLKVVDKDVTIVFKHTLSPYRSNTLGVCDLIFHFAGHLNYVDFPEWFAQKPTGQYIDESGHWWPIKDRESRRLALLEAIKLCP